MMHGDTDYALARLQARGSRRSDSDEWRQGSGARSLATLLEQLRASDAEPWVGDLVGSSETHAIEAQLRSSFDAQIRELASWADPQWQPALLWCARLVHLPALRSDYMADRAMRPDWPIADLKPFATPAEHGEIAFEAAWLQELLQRMPPLDADAQAEFSRLRGIVEQHRRRFSLLAAGNGWPERMALRQQLLARWRRNPLSPVHLLTAAALLLLDYERVRGELLRLAALPTESRS